MKKFLCLIIMSICLCGCSFASGNGGLEAKLITISDNTTISEVASMVESAVVGISGISDDGESVGSGVCVANGGYILTNSHVINGCDKIVLHLSDKTSTTAKIIYEDTVLDFAILKSNKSIPYLSLADSDEVVIGQDVLAVGTPLSLTLTHTFTKGIVSAVNRTLKVSGTGGEGYMQNLIQHDASLNPGNSGGPLINSNGQVIGINTLKISSGEGIGFAIPTKSFKSLLGNYVKNINYKTPYLGVYGFDSEIANYNGQSELNTGFYILDVSETSPLKNSGIEKSSVITKLNGMEIKNTLDFKEELYKLKANDIVSIEYYKNGKNYKLKTKLYSR